MGSQEQQRDVVIAENVANRLEGKKQFEILSRETVYYSRIVWATDEDEAIQMCHDDGDFGEPFDYGNWQFDDCVELKD